MFVNAASCSALSRTVLSKTGCRGNPEGVTEGERVAEPETDGVADPDGVAVADCECVGGLRD
jgi:hypothetical protein